MTKRSKILLIINGALLIPILCLLILVTCFVHAGEGIYPKNKEILDLREDSISVETYNTLAQKLPGCTIVWNVPFQGSQVSSNTDILTIRSLNESDLDMLRYMTDLKTVNAQDCTDYLMLAKLQQMHPDCDVIYSVPISGGFYDTDTTTLTLDGVTSEELSYLVCFPQLKSVQISGCSDYEQLLQLQKEYPQWNLTYTVSIGGQTVAWDTKTLHVEDATADEIALALIGMPSLKELKLTNPEAEATVLLSLQEKYPETDISWEVVLFGKTFNVDTTEVDISGNIVKSCEEIEKKVACLPNLEKLVMSDCGIDNETMAAFRERQRPNYKVVWTVYLSSKTKARTDDIYFMPIQQGEYYFLDKHSYNLRYCEDMICLDLGHHMIHNVDFLQYMPKLKYLILAHSGVRDISPIVYCQELVYLEVDWSEIQDYTPIAELKNLEDLNLNRTYRDITPILKMTWLKNLWAPGRSADVQQRLIEALPNTRLVLTEPTPEGEGWRNLPNYYAMRDLLGMPYMR